MFTSQMMKEVHRIAANLEGDYSARLVLAFREVTKNEEVVTFEEYEAKDIVAELLVDYKNVYVTNYKDGANRTISAVSTEWKRNGSKRETKLGTVKIDENGNVEIVRDYTEGKILKVLELMKCNRKVETRENEEINGQTYTY